MTVYGFHAHHEDLLEFVPSESAVHGGCDLVVVPNHLHPQRLFYAARLARGLHAPLLVICTAGHHEDAAAALVGRPRPADTWILALPWPAEGPLDALQTIREPGARSPRPRDIAAKRNVGLALARMLGRRRVLFLDDDVRGVSARAVQRGAAALGDLDAVGWRCESFPDNSIVCHARRAAGHDQGVFVGGGALLVDTSLSPPLFPPVYNEDWLFMFELLRRGRLGCAGAAQQLRHDPFGDLERARDQEFGDALGEGLYHLLHEGRRHAGAVDIDAATSIRFWEKVVHHRGRMIDQLSDELRARRGRLSTLGVGRHPRGVVWRAVASLEAAAKEHVDELPVHLASFVRAWRRDLALWRDWFDSLPRADHLREALSYLGPPSTALAEL